MGLAFDDNGSYVGWSSLFDYYNIDTLMESEKLPLPRRNTTLTLGENGVDINEELSQITAIDKILKEGKDTKGAPISEKDYRVQRLKLYNLIFTKLGNSTQVKTVKESDKDAFLALLNHFATLYPPGMQSQILRNFISSHILSTIQHIRNAADSYVPVTMGDLRHAADDSPKGQDAKTITLLNPLSIYKMLRLNMIGKNVIGIAATGQKASFMLSYYFNEIYKNAKEGVDYMYELDNAGNRIFKVIPGSKLAETLFSFKSSRLIKINNGEVNTLPDINMDGVVLELKEYALTHKLSPNKPVDIMISQLISAATDNAKELILDKINAGDNLAKCFLFGIVLGCDIPTLVDFMTSPVLSYINALANLNIFIRRELSVKLAINRVQKYFKARQVALQLNLPPAPNLLDAIVPSNLTIDLVDSYLEDILEFLNLLEAADEFSSLGRTLSVNLGIKTRAEDLEYVVGNITKMIQDRENALGIRNEGVLSEEMLRTVLKEDYNKLKNFCSDRFDVVKWLLDRTIIIDGVEYRYRKLTADYYDHIKKVFNVFGVIDTLPHFSSMFSLMGDVFTVHGFSTRTRIVLEAVKLYRDLSPTDLVDSKGYGQILSAANDLMLMKYFELANINFPIYKDYPLIKPDGTAYKAKGNTLLNLATDDGRAKFKYLFDNYVVAKLKAGNFFEAGMLTSNGAHISKEQAQEYNNLTSNNEFIISLMKGLDGDVPIWKTDIDMSSDNNYTSLKLAKFGKALATLHTIKIGEYSLADWLAVYNFIVNKNQYGSDRLTKAFESFIDTFNDKKDSILNDYFAFVGDLDYKGQDVLSEFNVHIYDMLMLSARTVDSLENALGLMVVKDLKYWVKAGMGLYKEFGDIAQTDSSMEVNELLNKYLIRKSYYTLSRPYSDFVNRVKYLLNGDKSAYKALAFLMLKGNLLININCE